MEHWFFETFNTLNHGKFMVCKFTGLDLVERCQVMGDEYPQLLIPAGRGWDPLEHLLIVDLQTGEGAIFKPGGLAAADLEKHKIWVCPMFEPFLEWFYEQDRSDLDALPRVIELPDAPMSWAGRRRPGPEPDDPGPAEVNDTLVFHPGVHPNAEASVGCGDE